MIAIIITIMVRELMGENHFAAVPSAPYGGVLLMAAVGSTARKLGLIAMGRAILLHPPRPAS